MGNKANNCLSNKTQVSFMFHLFWDGLFGGGEGEKNTVEIAFS